LADIQPKSQAPPTIEDLVDLYTPGEFLSEDQKYVVIGFNEGGLMWDWCKLDEDASWFQVQSALIQTLTKEAKVPLCPALPLALVTKDEENNLYAWFNCQGRMRMAERLEDSVFDTTWFLLRAGRLGGSGMRTPPDPETQETVFFNRRALASSPNQQPSYGH
jgi:hypothetical protein